MRPTEIMFSVNEYDCEGDIFGEGIFLHFGDARINVAESVDEFSAVIDRMIKIRDEIKENHNID